MSAVKSDTVFVSNLDPSIGEFELRNEIFTGIGSITSVVLNYDKNGASLGTATIQFPTHEAALQAYKEFNEAKIDGREMYVRLIATVPQPRQIVKQPMPQQVAKPRTTAKKQPVQHPQHPQHQRGAARLAPPTAVAGARRRGAAPAPLPAQRGVAPRRGGPAPRAAAAPRRPVAANTTGRRSGVAGVAPATRGRRGAAAPVPAGKKGPAGKKAAPAKKAAAKRAPVKKTTAADLDAALDKYNASRPSKE